MQLQLNSRNSLDREIRNYRLVGRGGWLTFVKIAVTVLLAAWNAHLFIQTIPGWMGYLTAATAVCLELSALYCVHNYTRSIGVHKQWLGRLAVILGLFSLIHCVAAIVIHTNYSAHPLILFYTHVVALPCIVVLLSLFVAIVAMNHWSASLIADLAKFQMEAMSERARVLSDERRLLDRMDLVRLRASLFEQETVIKSELVALAARRVAAGEQLHNVLAGIRDPQLRGEVQTAIAEVSGGPK
jgi:hypothetical protein